MHASAVAILAITGLCLAAGCSSSEPAPAPAPVASAPSAASAPAEPAAPSPAAAPAAPAPASTPVAAEPATEPAAAEPMTGSMPGDRIPAFTATVRRPGADGVKEEAFDSRATKGSTLYVVDSTTCPYCKVYAPRVKKIEAAYMEKGVDVIHVYPVGKESDADKIAWHEKQGFASGQILDAKASIARSLETAKTPTVYLVNAKGIILYRGAIDDAPMANAKVKNAYLANALDQHLAGKPVEVTSAEPAG